MKQFSLSSALYRSFYSKALYRDVARSWGGYAILYLLMLSALSWTVTVWQVQSAIDVGYHKNSLKYINQLPEVTIENGEIKTPENRAYVVRDPDTREVIAVIDPAGHLKNDKRLEKAAAVIVLKDRVIFKDSKKKQTRVYQVPKKFNQTLNPHTINGYLRKIIGFFWIPLFIFGVVCTFIYRLVQAFLYGLVGKFINYFYTNTSLTYGQITHLAMVAVTPAFMVATLKSWLFYVDRTPLYLYLILTVLYLLYGLVANKDKNKDV